MIRIYVKGEPEIKYSDLNLEILPKKNIAFFPCVDDPTEKKIVIFFIPEIKDDKDVRTYEMECKWPRYWTKLFHEGNDSIREKPQSEGSIDKFMIRLTIHKDLPLIKCQPLNNLGVLTPFEEDERGNKYCEWIINNESSSIEYVLNIKIEL